MFARTFGLAVALSAAGACAKSATPPKLQDPPTTTTPRGGETVRVGAHQDWKGVPLEEAVNKGLAWLVSVQGKDGGWGQDGGSNEVIRKDVAIESQGNDVANTSMACLALMRAGNTPSEGPHRDALARGIRFILSHVDESPDEGLTVTKRAGTQIQRKLGPNIDTFLANLVLAEADGRIADAVESKRVHRALEKCVAKIQRHQGKDGAWNEGGGWAPVIGTSLAARGLQQAEGKSAGVKDENLMRIRENAYASREMPEAAKADAGVALYSEGAAMAGLAAAPASDLRAAEIRKATASKLADQRFVGGFGSMGGEEFISYMNISDSLVRAGGEDWKKWNGKIKEHLLKLQNQDGTWAGHHCITGRVACTSGAILTLLAERTTAKS
jgi:hypothetical protein